MMCNYAKQTCGMLARTAAKISIMTVMSIYSIIEKLVMAYFNPTNE